MSSGKGSENFRNSSASPPWRLGDWTVHPASNELVHPVKDSVRVEARAMRVLELLREHRGEVVSTDEFLRRVWEGKVVTAHSVATVISELRKALGPDVAACIETIPKCGYRLRASSPAGEPWRRRSWRVGVVAGGLAIATAVLFWWGGTDSPGTAAAPALESGLTAQYLRARQLWSRREHDATVEARAILADIVARDARFAPAHAALADIYAHKTGEDLGLPELQTYREAQRHLDLALSLDPNLAESYVTQALLAFYRDHQPRKALASLDTALARDPQFAYAWQTRAMVLSTLGDHRQSLAAIERARTLDPVSNSIGWDRVWFLYLAGDQERAHAAFEQESRSSTPNNLFGALIEQARGNSVEALRWWLRRLEQRQARLADPAAIEALARESPASAYRELLRQTQAVPGYTESKVVIAAWQCLAGDSLAATATMAGAMPDRRSWLTLWAQQMPVLESCADIGSRHASAQSAARNGDPAPNAGTGR